MSRKAKLKDVSTVLAEALKLSLADRVNLRDALKVNIEKEVFDLKEAAKEAETISGLSTGPAFLGSNK